MWQQTPPSDIDILPPHGWYFIFECRAENIVSLLTLHISP